VSFLRQCRNIILIENIWIYLESFWRDSRNFVIKQMRYGVRIQPAADCWHHALMSDDSFLSLAAAAFMGGRPKWRQPTQYRHQPNKSLYGLRSL